MLHIGGSTLWKVATVLQVGDIGLRRFATIVHFGDVLDDISTIRLAARTGSIQTGQDINREG